ncbi:MAG: TolC family protein [Gemmatimonadota bacterium]
MSRRGMPLTLYGASTGTDRTSGRNSLAFLAVLGLALTPTAKVRAQALPVDSVLTLPHALAIAEARDPRLRGRASEVRAAEHTVTLSAQRLLPSIDLGAQVARATDNNITGASFPQAVVLPVSGPVRTTSSGTQVYGSAIGAMVAWAPFTFGQVGAQRRQARAELRLANAGMSGELFDERVTVATAYLGLLRARELVRVQRQSLVRAEASARAVRALAASGLRPGADSLLAGAEVSRARIDLLAAERDAANAGGRLGELLGAWSEVPQLSSTPFLDTIPDVPATRPPPDLAQHPHLEPFIARVAIGAARQAIAAGSALPRLSLVGAITARGSGIAPDGVIDRSFSGGIAPERTNVAVGVMVNLPLTDALFSGSRAGIESARLDAARAELSAQEDHVRAGLLAADANLSLALSVSREVPLQLSAASAAYQQVSSRYAAGLATLPELAQAQLILTRAEVDSVLARVAAWTAWLDRCASQGNLAPFLASVP